MFTGLISELGEFVSISKNPTGASLKVKGPDTARDAAIGDSIAVNGACLTVTANTGGVMSFDASTETLAATTLGKLAPGDRINLEPSLRPNSKLGGHFVTGHVDAVGRIRSRTREGRAIKYEIQAPDEVIKYLVDKGSVAVDGISLTVVKVLRDAFTLVIIPHTAEVTSIGLKGPGNTVNLEADILGKYVYRFLNRDKDTGLMDALKRNGFM